MRPSRTIPFVVLAFALLACTIQSQAAARPALATPTPSPAPMVDSTGSVSTPNPTRPAMPTAAALRCVVSTGTPGGFLNLRAGPGMAYGVLQVLQEGQRVTLLQAGTWYQVQAGGAVGWIHSHFCEVTP